MSEDLIQRATKALREQGGAEPPADRAAFMRARLLSQAQRRSKLRPHGIWQWAAVVCLGFFVSTAMAQVIAVQLPRVIEALRREPAHDAKPKQAKPPRPAKSVPPKAAPPVQPEPAAPSVIEQPPAAGAAPPLAAAELPPQQRSSAAEAPVAPSGGDAPPARPAAPPRQPARASRAPSRNIPSTPSEPPPLAAKPEPETLPAARAPEEPATTAAPKGAAPDSAELALFRRAQALHVAHDPRAIAAWDAFLRVAGASVLAPEARYNRALGLVRASRFEEARRALQPFAAGAYGSYRKREAQALLERLPQ